VEAGSHLVSGNEPLSNASFTFHAQNSELNCAFLTVREVAERLRVCRATVYRMIDEGSLQAVRVSSGAIRVAVDAVAGIPVPPATSGRRSRRS
jgi:excisionase family DNA binding protein